MYRKKNIGVKNRSSSSTLTTTKILKGTRGCHASKIVGPTIVLLRYEPNGNDNIARKRKQNLFHLSQGEALINGGLGLDLHNLGCSTLGVGYYPSVHEIFLLLHLNAIKIPIHTFLIINQRKLARAVPRQV